MSYSSGAILNQSASLIFQLGNQIVRFKRLTYISIGLTLINLIFILPITFPVLFDFLNVSLIEKRIVLTSIVLTVLSIITWIFFFKAKQTGDILFEEIQENHFDKDTIKTFVQPMYQVSNNTKIIIAKYEMAFFVALAITFFVLINIIVSAYLVSNFT